MIRKKKEKKKKKKEEEEKKTSSNHKKHIQYISRNMFVCVCVGDKRKRRGWCCLFQFR